MNTIQHKTLNNGLRIFLEKMPTTRAISLKLITPAGCALEPSHLNGLGTLLADMAIRGTLRLNAKQHADAIADLGARRSVSTGLKTMGVSGVCLKPQLEKFLPLFLAHTTSPAFDPQAFSSAKALCLQELASTLDSPQRRCIDVLQENHEPAPYNRNTMGSKQGLTDATLADVKQFWQSHCVPNGSVLSVVGNIEMDDIAKAVEQLTSEWIGTTQHPIYENICATRGANHHIKEETEQAHLGLAWTAPPCGDANELNWVFASGVLSGGMSGRLFTEVREKRGLCYSVVARYQAMKESGKLIGYVGTTPERLDEAYTTYTQEMQKLKDGVSEDEFARVKTGIRAALVMQGESSEARARAIANDVIERGAPRTLQERDKNIASYTFTEFNHFLTCWHLEEPTTCVLGPNGIGVQQ